jgi:integrase
MAYVIETAEGRLKAAYKDHVKGTWKRTMVPAGTTKREADRLAHELEQNSWREAEGLAVRRSDVPTTLTEICKWWWEERCPAASRLREEVRLKKHVLEGKIASMRLGQIDSSEISQLLHGMERAGSAAGSVNKLRSTLHSVFAQAIDAKKMTGANPVTGVKTRPVPKRAYSILRADEVSHVLDKAGDTWRDLCATALYLGLRKGELFGLRREDVNLVDRELTIARSHSAETTKGKKAVVLPIPKVLFPFLEHALSIAPGKVLFPTTDGAIRPESTSMDKVWHRILVRADVVTHYRHTCRRCVQRKRPATYEFADAAVKRCPHPDCGMRMWPAGVARPMRFHDVRHTTATLLLKAGVPIQHVQRILRHANIRTTVDTYGHLANEDLRAPLELLPKARHVPVVCTPTETGKEEGPGPEPKLAESGAFEMERNTRFELATFALARRRSTN